MQFYCHFRFKMVRFCTFVCLTLLVLVSVASAQRSSKKPNKGNKNDGKIVGGRDASIQEFPYLVSLRDRGGHFCGGSIISPNYVLTAAHCTDEVSANNLEIWAGITHLSRERPAQKSRARTIINHPSYNPRTTDNDIALIRLANPFIFTGNVRAIDLDRNEFTVPDQLKVAGWGATFEGGRATHQLQTATIPGISRAQCRALYSNFAPVTNNMICAGYLSGGVDACQGDSGGPAVSARTNRQVGIVSWGAGCARRNRPGVYTNVAMYQAWIRRHTGLSY